ncbi:PGF-pre-PGF domain-containing protein [Natronolimnobius sp. AArcel1]|uniref:PGF-pre-PGF domain-containing protein n=1 Tax=Natronolimnobius sp. AArcel1 TaxID=1679093 RepID=UPI0013ED8FB9|nr:PGF-pre-PGF domain-containing protein [Natronolimnobius sp. AArcel1]NGM71200.1 PGF-pre-PGF domain-containing protein [Natronolimnobius sp. AArcel1]
MNEKVIAVALVALVAFGGIAAVAQPVAASSTQPSANDEHVVEQDGECYPIEALTSSGTVEAFYDYRNHETHPEDVDRMYSSYGTEHLQEDNTSVLFLHEGTDGMSLVMIHDQVDGDTTGGVATFEITGAPAEAEWVVQDDLYDSEENMVEWYDEDGWLGADWIWSEARTDGGAIQGGLNDDFAMTIHPAFNEDAALYDVEDIYDPDFHENGTIDDWEVLSGDSDDPDRTDLDLDEPVTIRTGSCDGPSVSYDQPGDGDTDELTATIDGADASDEIALQPLSGTDSVATFDDITMTDVDGNGSVTFANDADGLPDTPSDIETFSSLSVTSDSLEDSSATVSFSVDADTLEEHQLSPDEVALYEADGDEWEQVPTSVTDQTGSEYRYSADISSLEGLMIGEQQEQLTDDDSADGTDSSGADDDGASSMPGFAVGSALSALAVLCVALAARTRLSQ